MHFLLLLLLVPILFLYNVFSWGYILSCLYYWFVLPTIPTLPTFTLIQFIGFMFFVDALIRHPSQRTIKSEYLEDDKTKYYITQLVLPWATLFFAWAFHAIFF
jgi:hypothetical protein